MSEEEGFINLLTESQPIIVHHPHISVTKPMGWKEHLFMSQSILEVNRKDRDSIIQLTTTIEIPVKFLIPHHHGEVHKIEETTDKLTRMKRIENKYSEFSGSPKSNTGAA